MEQDRAHLLSFIARNWRGQPLVSRQAIVSLIAAITSTTGLKVYARLDEGEYQRAVKVSDAEMRRSTWPGLPGPAPVLGVAVHEEGARRSV